MNLSKIGPYGVPPRELMDFLKTWNDKAPHYAQYVDLKKLAMLDFIT